MTFTPCQSRSCQPRLFGEFNGVPIHEVEIAAPDGSIRAAIMNWGAVIRDLEIRLADGSYSRVVLGFERLEHYVAHSPHFGAIAGQFANRIAHGRFTLDGVEYQLPQNDGGKHSLHGGGQGFGKRPWKMVGYGPAHVRFALQSTFAQANYPSGTINSVHYRLGAKGCLHVEMTSKLADNASKATIINLCQHSYFNLGGAPDILDHQLQVDADHFTVVDKDLIPNGEIRSVAGTPLERRSLSPVRRADPADPARSFHTDHNFVLHKRITGTSQLDFAIPLHRAARLVAPQGAVSLEVWTDAPGLQVYDGHKVKTPVPGLSGAPYGAFAGICLETQDFPDAPNHAHFPSAVLRPGEAYRHVVEYRFTI